MSDTVAAISTPPGEGGIGVIRISGAESRAVLERLFWPGKRGLAAGGLFPDRRMRYGRIVDPRSGAVLDEVLAVFMKAPRTYTGEDVAEIHCHGSAAALRRVLALALREGARLAEAGEFTKRAFLNGRLDLAQAEAVIDLIQAKADTTFDAAIRQLDGSLSHAVKGLRDRMTELLVRVAAELDYPEEDIETLPLRTLSDWLSAIGDEIEKLNATAHAGRIVREGLRVVIAGKPNVGKSSLLNALLRESRAIVTDVPGTTRDLIEEGLHLRGLLIRLIDTAGIRETADPVESLGVAGSREAIARSDLVLFVLDASAPLEDADLRVLQSIANRRFVVILNKCDLPMRVNAAAARAFAATAADGRTEAPVAVARTESAGTRGTEIPFAVVSASMRDGTGLSALEDAIERFVFRGRALPETGVFVTNVRHADLLERALAEIREAAAAVSRGEAIDLAEINIRRAWELLGEITGETAGIDLVEEVFARFCLGK
ncbi:MAG: tRNA uridine-5-carboxymethylaminomethyl(34) synthesis GTPase MnmE [Clostridiales Family XIII bacterium]|jgi:tRNA modification GTPase|nr:tRNA uridine-5-carboxymethylaminomethyl(34) synthesis GTPase MnmE [Clostridiales Family XIII bacterium]